MSDIEDTFVEQVKLDYSKVVGSFPKKLHLLDIAGFIPILIEVVERTIVNGKKLSGSEKRDAIVQIICDLVNIPLLPAFIEKWVVGLIVDAVISFANAKLGHAWDQAPVINPSIAAAAKAAVDITDPVGPIGPVIWPPPPTGN